MFKPVSKLASPVIDSQKKDQRLDNFFQQLFTRQPTCRQSSLLLHYDPQLPSNLYPKSIKEILPIIAQTKWPSEKSYKE